MYISIKLRAYYYQEDFFVRIQEGAITLTRQSQTHVKKGPSSVRMAEIHLPLLLRTSG